MPSTPVLVPVLGGPTASGKSDVALDLAETLGLEIVAADAMQVYRGLDVGTAKPSAAQRQRVTHHLIDVVEPSEPFSVADWVRRAEAAIAEVRGRGRLPFVVGGTGFYIRALCEGLPTVPAADPEAQRPLWEQLERHGIDTLLAELRRASPDDAERTQRNPRRVVRALEILRRTGRPPSTFPRERPAHRYDKAVLVPPMAALRPRIERRTRAMFEGGLVQEVRALLAEHPGATTALQAIGYKEVVRYLRGEIDLERARADVIAATVAYAKRQRTWFAREPKSRRIPLLAEEAQGEIELWLKARVAALG